MGVLNIISCLVYMGLAGLLLEIDTAAGAIMFVVLAPMIVGTFFYIKMMIYDNKESRGKLVWAIWLTFGTILAGAICQYAAVHSLGKVNSTIVKINNAASSATHVKDVNAKVIARPSKDASIGYTLV